MIKRHTIHSVPWLDVLSPTENDLRGLSDEFSLDPRTLAEIASPSPRSSVYAYEREIFAVLHFPVNKQTHSEKASYEQEVNFIVGDNFCITVRYDTVDTIHRFGKQADADAVIKHSTSSTSGLHVFISLLNAFYASIDDELHYLEDVTDTVEERIFQGDERNMVESLSQVSRIFMDFRKTLSLQTDSINDLQEIIHSFFGEQESARFEEVYNTHEKFLDTIGHELEAVSELRETNNSLLTAKQNEIVKKLTIMAVLTLPITMVASLFGMNTVNAPLIGHVEDFWLITIVGAFVSLVIFLYFKRKHWF